jgi:hypothetical protein
MRNLTPEHLRCAYGTCPAVYELEDGRLLIVGKWANSEMRGDVPVGEDETAIVIDRAYLANVPNE